MAYLVNFVVNQEDPTVRFAHEKLMVYHKILAFIGCAEDWLGAWDRRHAFVDHLSRASESVLSNLVEAVRLRKEKPKQRSLDYALGSTLECAACMDIACLKGLLGADETSGSKNRLVEIARMLIGLRRSWERPRLAEEAGPYGSESHHVSAGTVFHHEDLDVYRLALGFHRWLVAHGSGHPVAGRLGRKLDRFATSIVLNVAEGNGRFSVLEQGGFLDVANAAAARAAAFLDVGVMKRLWSEGDVADAKTMLVRIGQMTARRDHHEFTTKFTR